MDWIYGVFGLGGAYRLWRRGNNGDNADTAFLEHRGRADARRERNTRGQRGHGIYLSGHRKEARRE